MFLEQINGPDDLKKINIKNLDELAEEIVENIEAGLESFRAIIASLKN